MRSLPLFHHRNIFYLRLDLTGLDLVVVVVVVVVVVEVPEVVEVVEVYLP